MLLDFKRKALGHFPCVAAAVGAGIAVSGVASAAMSSSAASDAASQQSAATQSQIGQQNYEFNTIRGLLKPYVDAGTGALSGYNGAVQGYQGILGNLNNLTGANGNPAQQTAINGLQQNPLYTTSMNLGQQAILANASATGGLRGGNTIASLGYLPGQVLSNVMQTQIGNLGTSLNGQQSLAGLFGNLINVGQNSAAGTGQAAMNTGNNITSLIGQQGAIGAGATLAGTNAINSGINSISGALGSYLNNGNLSSLQGSAAGISNGTTPQDLIASYTG